MGPGGVAPETAREMAMMGAPSQQIEQRRKNFERPVAVHPENWTAVQVFRLCTVPSVGVWNGLAAVQVEGVEIAQAAKTWGVPMTPYLVHAVRIIAAEYCRTRNEALSRK
jgi:hypothetical protein